MHGKQVYDNVTLGAWVHRVRKQGREGRLSALQMGKLDKLLFVWNVDLQSANWHHLLHEARRYKVSRTGSCCYNSLMHKYLACAQVGACGKRFLLK